MDDFFDHSRELFLSHNQSLTTISDALKNLIMNQPLTEQQQEKVRVASESRMLTDNSTLSQSQTTELSQQLDSLKLTNKGTP